MTEEHPNRDTRENKEQWAVENTNLTDQGAQPSEANENARIRTAYESAPNGADRDPKDLKKNNRFGIPEVDKELGDGEVGDNAEDDSNGKPNL